HPSLRALLHFLITARQPNHESAHRGSQQSLLPGALTRAQRRPLDLSRAHLHDQQTGPYALPRRHPQPPVPTQPMASLRVSHTRNSRSARYSNGPSPDPPVGAKSSTTSSASLAAKASPSRALAVEAKLAGRPLPSMAAPKCCWASAARAVLKTPLLPLKKRVNCTAPNAARYTPASSGKLIRSGAVDSNCKLARTARTTSPASGDGRRRKCCKAAGNCTCSPPRDPSALRAPPACRYTHCPPCCRQPRWAKIRSCWIAPDKYWMAARACCCCPG